MTCATLCRSNSTWGITRDYVHGSVATPRTVVLRTRRVVRASPDSKDDSAGAAAEATATASDSKESVADALKRAERTQGPRKKSVMRPEEATDFMSSMLTRRFGLKGGLAWLGLLTLGVVGEQVKTRLEVAADEKNTVEVQDAKEVRLASGVSFVELVRGGGSPVQPGFLTVVNFRATADGEVFEDTYARGKPIVFVFGRRPFTGGMCKGVEEALATMRAGGRRIITVPPEMGFGNEGAAIRGTRHAGDKDGVVPPGATLVYDLTLERVSIPPS